MDDETLETDGNDSSGNTKEESKRIVPSKYWIFTYNNYKESDLETLETTFKLNKIKYIFGREVAPTTGTPHLQGYIESPIKIRPKEKLKLTDKISWRKRAKFATREHNIDYCSKECNDIRTNFNIPVDPLKNKILYDYQKQVIDICKSAPDDRKIYVYIDKKGNKGKTSLCKHICMNYNAIYLSGKCNDCKSAIATLEEKPEICVFDFVRSVEDYVSYEAIESVKNGIFFNGKYESSMCIFNPPHVFIFCNFDLEYEKLSKDRWIINYL